jgi:hypothetical protein
MAVSGVIAIESQPFGSRTTAANNRMRCIQSCIETWSAIRVPNATVISIGAKAKNVEGDTYARRKKNAVAKVTELIESDVVWSIFFANAGNKRDDLADAFLIARVALERSKPKKRKRRSPKHDTHSGRGNDHTEPLAATNYDAEEAGEIVDDGHLVCPVPSERMTSYEVEQAELEFMQDA